MGLWDNERLFTDFFDVYIQSDDAEPSMCTTNYT